MTWPEALEIVLVRTRHERYRWLCSEENPNVEQRDAYRIQIVQMVEGPLDDIARMERAYAIHGTQPLKGGCCGGM